MGDQWGGLQQKSSEVWEEFADVNQKTNRRDTSWILSINWSKGRIFYHVLLKHGGKNIGSCTGNIREVGQKGTKNARIIMEVEEDSLISVSIFREKLRLVVSWVWGLVSFVHKNICVYLLGVFVVCFILCFTMWVLKMCLNRVCSC